MKLLRAIIETLFWTLAAICVVGLVMIVLGWSTAPTLSYIGAVALLALFPLALRIMRTVHRRRADAVIAYLEQAVRLNLPLTRMIEAAQRSEGGRLGERLAHLWRQLSTGQSIGASIEAAVPEISAADSSTIEAAERIGRLPQALHRLTRRQIVRLTDDATSASVLRAYPFAMVLIIAGASAMFAIFVLPKYESIFADFAVPLPPVTEAGISVMRAAGPIAAVLAALVLLAWLAGSIWRVAHPRSARWNVLHRIRDRILWFTPFAGRISRDRSLSAALHLMADAINAGQPFDRAVDEASRMKINDVLRERFIDWTAYLRTGASPHESARSAGMPSLIVEFLAPVRGGEQAADVLGFLARYYDARFSRAQLLLQAAAVPAMVLFFAVLVAFVALSMLAPMMKLVDTLSAAAIQGGGL